MQTIIRTSKLAPGVSHGDYQKFLVDVKIPRLARSEGFVASRVHRIQGVAAGGGEPRYDNIEFTDVTSVESCRGMLAGDSVIRQGETSHTVTVDDVYGALVVERPPQPGKVSHGTAFDASRNLPGIGPEDFQRWVEEFEFPRMIKLSSYVAYKVYRIDGSMRAMEAKPFDFMRVPDFTTIDEWRQEMQENAGVQEIFASQADYAEDLHNTYGVPLANEQDAAAAPATLASPARELARSSARFAWAMTMFGARQMANVIQPQRAAAALDSLAAAAEEQLEGGLRQAFKSGDALQRRVVDTLFDTFAPARSQRRWRR